MIPVSASPGEKETGSCYCVGEATLGKGDHERAWGSSAFLTRAESGETERVGVPDVHCGSQENVLYHENRLKGKLQSQEWKASGEYLITSFLHWLVVQHMQFCPFSQNQPLASP